MVAGRLPSDALTMDNSGSIDCAPNLRIHHHSPDVILKRNQQRARRRFLRRAGIVALTVIILAIWGGVEINREFIKPEQERRFRQLESQVQAVSHSYDVKAGNPMWARFLPQEWTQYDKDVSEARQTIIVLSRHLGDDQLEGQLRRYLEEAESSRKKLEDDVQSFLELKIHERCPMHPQAVRDPGSRACPLPPADHYRFPFWQEPHRVSWRLADGWSGRYSLEPRPAAHAVTIPKVSTAQKIAARRNDIFALVQGWQSSFQQNDIEKNAGYYAPIVESYFRKRNLTRGEVRGERENMISTYGPVRQFDVTAPSITSMSDVRAEIRFRTHWELSGRGLFSGEDIEKLTLKWAGDRWEIVREEEPAVFWVKKR